MNGHCPATTRALGKSSVRCVPKFVFYKRHLKQLARTFHTAARPRIIQYRWYSLFRTLKYSYLLVHHALFQLSLLRLDDQEEQSLDALHCNLNHCFEVFHLPASLLQGKDLICGAVLSLVNCSDLLKISIFSHSFTQQIAFSSLLGRRPIGQA